ncbi:VOC family protein [Nonomuraea sp. SBT364]|uniref:VOC family protein n=1 Tax=Nonomuraea sp. SBT364 TaxID=1580530 RepID=UPI00066C4177|nr:VOC family protein [Nonomuraea sp. SBT364]
MIADLECVVLDCPDPAELAAFYQALLGGTVDRPDKRWSLDDDWSTLHTPSGLVLAFQRAADHRPPRWPDPAHPQQFHLDLRVADLDAAEEHVLARGAAKLAGDPAEPGWRVFADPAGHPFCLLRHSSDPEDA